MTTDPVPARAGTSSWFNVPGWAAYLACSWTWCIGMFLPVLLVRDFGIWGFVVFAAPNVIGAAAMGWVLRREDQSREITRQHASACAWFSIVTATFQLFFALTLMRVVLGRGDPDEQYLVFLPALLVGLVTLTLPRLGSWVLWIGSVVLLTLAWERRGWGWDIPAPLLPLSDLIWLAPVCLFGFILCPYLDLTFHHARQACTARQARGSFTLGFGGLFLMMILGTLTYTPAAMGVLDGSADLSRTVYAYLVAAHIGAQLGNTIVLHAARLRPVSEEGWDWSHTWQVVALVVGVVVMVALPMRWHGLVGWEVIYRCFMSFYGLVFPAYVWICMIPSRGSPDESEGSRRRKLVVLGAAVCIAAPAFWMGFIERQTWWLGPGLAVVLAARVFVPGGARRLRS